MRRFYSICFTTVLVLFIAVQRHYVQGILKGKYLVSCLYTNSEGKSMTIMAGQMSMADRTCAVSESLHVDTTVPRNKKERGRGDREAKDRLKAQS